MMGDFPPAAAAGFDKLKWIVLFRGPYAGAKPVLEKLKSAELYHRFEILEHRAIGSGEVVVSVPAPLLQRAREILGDDPAPTSS